MRELFCATEQIATQHTVSVDSNGEILVKCSTEDCGHFWKLPAGMDQAAIELEFAKYGVVNAGQASVEVQEKLVNELIDNPQPVEYVAPVQEVTELQAEEAPVQDTVQAEVQEETVMPEINAAPVDEQPAQ